MNRRSEFIGSLRRAANDLFQRLSAGPPKTGLALRGRQLLPAGACDRRGPRDTAAVLDISGSMGISDYPPTRLGGGIEATCAYIDTRGQICPSDRIALVSFNHAARVVLPLTPITERKMIGRALRRLRDDGGTDLAEGLQAAVRLFTHERSTGRRRHVILLTDGQGGEPLEMAIRLKERLGVVIDAVGIGGSPDEVNETLLRQVATTDPDGFCHYRFIKDTQMLSEHYTQLAQGLIWRGGKK
jgi:hypothetical protein